MNSFIFDSEEFQREPKDNPHHAGELEFLRSVLRPGMHVIEAGADRGVTAVATAREIGTEGRLYAFEPVPEFYAELKEKIADLKARMPVHSAKPAMFQELEEMEERLRSIEKDPGRETPS